MNPEDMKHAYLVQQLREWENEINRNGYINNEENVLKELQRLEEESHPELVSTLLTMVALTRIKKLEKDTIAIAWLNKAIQLDPENQRAVEFLTFYEWEDYENFLDQLTFPSIRETDNRTAKKRIAEQYIHICKEFLNDAENEKEKLIKNLRILKSLNQSSFISIYETIIKWLDQSIQITELLLKAANEYDQSISGVFYTSAHYEEMKPNLVELEKIKGEWRSLFSKQQQNIHSTSSSLIDLNHMIGLNSVKARVNNYYQFLKYQKTRKSLGFHMNDEMSLNMIFTGNPGTGKTSLARLLAKIYFELGVLPSERFIEADRSQLVGGYIGQSEENVRRLVEQALGGVLFIDEAYSLKREGQSGNDYGQTVIDTLVSLMTGKEYGGKFSVILAGYPDEMRQFLDANPGLRSRFPHSNQIHLPDYTNEELLQIAEKFAMDNDYLLADEGKLELLQRIEKERVDDTFGNARTVKNIVLDAIFKKGSTKVVNRSIVQYSLLEREDFKVKEEEKLIDPQEKLDQLIGLHEIKEEMKSFQSLINIQKIRREHGLPVIPIQFHSVFFGNAGTGKTTVATLYAELLKKNGILKRGHLLVTSRADFVAGYVGQTALKTKKKIREALGGVLFIDEAYSLLSETAGDFAKEAIDTLVDEMTKHNENLVVILSGYPNEMEKLLESNPGLKSRFKKFFHFKDYTIEELIFIMKNYAATYHLKLTNEAEQFIVDRLNYSHINGNGRFATNVIDEAIQVQALRLLDEKDENELLKQSSYLLPYDLNKALEKWNRGGS